MLAFGMSNSTSAERRCDYRRVKYKFSECLMKTRLSRVYCFNAKASKDQNRAILIVDTTCVPDTQDKLLPHALDFRLLTNHDSLRSLLHRYCPLLGLNPLRLSSNYDSPTFRRLVCAKCL
ncbi:hypothetical protein CDAR_254741 [Caerostris darwini]|uniref:Uncharacterized protein n=1 Tax=Caerostris darwini TaxID=1538125 RepID=A0AAV4VPW2_9ARAC|nr:hypothetical protein CDAR_254741 [Caerostris darwini]